MTKMKSIINQTLQSPKTAKIKVTAITKQSRDKVQVKVNPITMIKENSVTKS